MANENDALPRSFPRALRGYAIPPVDDYVSAAQARIESLQLQLRTETDRGRRVIEQMTIEVETLRGKITDAEKRGTAESDARVRTEEMYARLKDELKQERENSLKNLKRAQDEARDEREMLVADERHATSGQIAEARREIERLQAENERLANEVLTLQRHLAEVQEKASRASEPLLNANAQQLWLEDEIQAQRDYAREQIDMLVAEVRQNAEEAAARAASFYLEYQDRLRVLVEECEALVSPLRVSVVPQSELRTELAFHPEAPASALVEDAHTERPGETLDWRGAEWRERSDWRTAS